MDWTECVQDMPNERVCACDIEPSYDYLTTRIDVRSCTSRLVGL